MNTGQGVEQFVGFILKDGFVVINDVVALRKINNIHTDFGYQGVNDLTESTLIRCNCALKVGHRRYFINPIISQGLDDPDIYANPYVVKLVRSILGEDAILESFGIIVSFPGSEMQHVHRDGPPLFPGSLGLILPPHALTVAMPLVDMDDLNGSTGFYPGSQHRTGEAESSSKFIIPFVPVGSCAIWDYRVFHAGLPNKSQLPRPILYMTYSKQWFRDAPNYMGRNKQRLNFNKQSLRNLPESIISLFSHLDL